MRVCVHNVVKFTRLSVTKLITIHFSHLIGRHALVEGLPE